MYVCGQVPFVDLRDTESLSWSEFDALVALNLSVSNRDNEAIAIRSSSVTTRYHPTRLPLFYQFLRSLAPPSPPSSSPMPPSSSPRIILQVAQVVSLWLRGGGGGTGALTDPTVAPPHDAYSSFIKGEMSSFAFGNVVSAQSHGSELFLSFFNLIISNTIIVAIASEFSIFILIALCTDLVFDVCSLPLKPNFNAPPLFSKLASLAEDTSELQFSLPPTLIYATAAALVVRGPALASAMYVTVFELVA
jgi:hypothetical protein